MIRQHCNSGRSEDFASAIRRNPSSCEADAYRCVWNHRPPKIADFIRKDNNGHNSGQ